MDELEEKSHTQIVVKGVDKQVWLFNKFLMATALERNDLGDAEFSFKNLLPLENTILAKMEAESNCSNRYSDGFKEEPGWPSALREFITQFSASTFMMCPRNNEIVYVFESTSTEITLVVEYLSHKFVNLDLTLFYIEDDEIWIKRHYKGGEVLSSENDDVHYEVDVDDPTHIGNIFPVPPSSFYDNETIPESYFTRMMSVE